MGVVYEMDVGHKAWLDRVEGLGQGYDELSVAASSGPITHDLFLYVADARYIDDSLSPYSWYKALVAAGARLHGLPSQYIDRIERVTAIDHHDFERAGKALR